GYDIAIESTRLFTSGLTMMRDDGVFFVSDGIVASRDRRLDLLNVKYLLTVRPGEDFDAFAAQAGAEGRFSLVYQEGSIAVFENKRVLPRAFVVPRQGIEVIMDPAAQLNRLKDSEFDPLKSVVVAKPFPGDDTAGTDVAGGADGAVSGDVR